MHQKKRSKDTIYRVWVPLLDAHILLPEEVRSEEAEANN